MLIFFIYKKHTIIRNFVLYNDNNNNNNIIIIIILHFLSKKAQTERNGPVFSVHVALIHNIFLIDNSAYLIHVNIVL